MNTPPPVGWNLDAIDEGLATGPILINCHGLIVQLHYDQAAGGIRAAVIQQARPELEAVPIDELQERLATMAAATTELAEQLAAAYEAARTHPALKDM